MSTTQINAELLSVRSHGVRIGNNGHVEHEECYPVMAANWRGSPVEVQITASRYVTADGEWTDWRIFASSGEDAEGKRLTEKARSKMSELAYGIVYEWLNSDAYHRSRQRAFKYEIRSKIREERYDAERPFKLITRYSNELSEFDRATLSKAVTGLKVLIDALNTEEE